MILIPAIDIRDGKVVRLTQGDYRREKIYSDNQGIIAQKWIEQGAGMLHIVDLDGAREGRPVNYNTIKEIIKSVSVPVECGGGLRTTDSIEQYLQCGIARVVIGTKALDDELVKTLIHSFGNDKVVVGIDACDGKVKTEGWLKDSGLSVAEVCEKVIHAGVRQVIFTDITRDGTLQGPNIQSLKKVLAYSELTVVASGGVCTMDDIRGIAAIDAVNLYGIIIGKALYEGSLCLKEARAVIEK